MAKWYGKGPDGREWEFKDEAEKRKEEALASLLQILANPYTLFVVGGAFLGVFLGLGWLGFLAGIAFGACTCGAICRRYPDFQWGYENVVDRCIPLIALIFFLGIAAIAWQVVAHPRNVEKFIDNVKGKTTKDEERRATQTPASNEIATKQEPKTVKEGMTENQVLAILGKPDRIGTNHDTYFFWWYYDGGNVLRRSVRFLKETRLVVDTFTND